MTNCKFDINSQTPEAYARVIADQYLNDLSDPKLMYAFLTQNESDFVMGSVLAISRLFSMNDDLWFGDEWDRKWYAAQLSFVLLMVMANAILGDRSQQAKSIFLEIIEHVAMQEAQERFDRA